MLNITECLVCCVCVLFFYGEIGKISAQLHTTLCIQFLDRENQDKTIRQYIAIGKTFFFFNNMDLCGNFTAKSIMVKNG